MAIMADDRRKLLVRRSLNDINWDAEAEKVRNKQI
jgi:hypothetical protein